MRIQDRYQLAQELEERYWAAGRRERGGILDAFCLATGYHRKYAVAILRGRRRKPKVLRRPRKRRYGRDYEAALQVCWEASGYICAERLQPFLPELLALLERHHQLRLYPRTRELLLAGSVATVGRTLQGLSTDLVRRRLSQTKPGSLLRRQIPVVVGKWKELDEPGYLEIDLVSHSGEVAIGDFIYTLSAVDISTGWSERVAILSKSQLAVARAIDQVREQLPFPLRGLHPDNGNEFLNRHLLAWCRRTKVELARSRAYHKNDNPHVEQKNWTLVRRLIGYQRLDTFEQLAWLNELYTEFLRPYANCFQPVMKLVRREVVGQRTRKVYDRPTTPLQRVLASAAGQEQKVQQLLDYRLATSPLTLKRQLDRRLAAMPAALKVRASA